MDKPVFPPEYFRDEVRCGFYISEMMKRFWAAELIVLYEIVKICERHSIRWYADMGTLLGAVRHKGYVPWDDDLDISMNRPDWEKFFEVAQDELPEEYYALSVRNNEEYGMSLGRVCNSHGIHSDRDHLEKFCGCPYCVGVDIYPIDRLYKDPAKEQERKDRGKAISRVFDLIESEGIKSDNTRKLLAEIERSNHTVLHRNGKLSRELTLLFERICLECKDDDYDEVAFNHEWILWDWANCPRRDYEDQIDIPFENTFLKATKYYDELLTIYYHDYMQIYKGGGAHEYPIYQDQEQILREHLGHNPYRYTFDRAGFSYERKAARFRDKALKITELMSRVTGQIATMLSSGNENSVLELLSGCGQITGTLSQMLIDKYGDSEHKTPDQRITGNKNAAADIIRSIEEYADISKQVAELIKAGTDHLDKTLIKLSHLADQISSDLTDLLDNGVRSVVFLPVRSAWWETMKPLYELMMKDPDYDVQLMPISYFDKDPMGGIGERHDDSRFFSEVVNEIGSGNNTESRTEYTGGHEYDMMSSHIDIIITQFPFDGFSCAIGIDDKYHTDNLLKCCDELWYLPCFDPDPPESEEDKAVKAIAVLTEQPAVVNSDLVILHDERMRDFYVKQLTELAGEDTREYWEQKIIVISGEDES